MKSTVLWALVLLNAILLVTFLGRVTRDNAALAQPARATSARPGDYLMVPADVVGASNGIVVIVDQTNGQLSAMSYDENSRRLVNMAKIDLAQVFQRGTGGRNQGGR